MGVDWEALHAVTLQLALDGLDYAKLRQVIHQTRQLQMDEDISHQIFMVLPGDQRFRWRVDIVSEHVRVLLSNALTTEERDGRQALYDLLISHAATRAAAGYM